MSRPRNIHAIATKASIDAALATAETLGELVTRHDSEAACLRFRNALYKRRSRERKNAETLLGVAASPLDKFHFRFYPETRDTRHCDTSFDSEPTGKWLFIISYQDSFEFEILLPELSDEEFDALPSFDIPQSHEPEEDWI